MRSKTVLIAAIIAIGIATICIAATELANAQSGEYLLKLMFAISLIIIDVYAIVAILRSKD